MKDEIRTPGYDGTHRSKPGRSLLLINSPLPADFQGERTVAEFPFFVLSKNKHFEPMIFEADSKYGIATIYDKEILLYIASLLVDMQERGEKIDRTVRFPAHDLFRVTDTNSSKRSYNYLMDALSRLRSTMIETNIVTGGEREETNFSWLDKFTAAYTEPSPGDRRIKHVEITLCDWFLSCRAARSAHRDISYGLFPALADRTPPLRARAVQLRARTYPSS